MTQINISSETKSQILNYTNTKEIDKIELIQNLWNNYGHLLRIHLIGEKNSSVILKHAKIPKEQKHPKGFDSIQSQERKIKSYQVETTWYEKYNHKNLSNNRSITPKVIGVFQTDSQYFILMEDLKEIGFTQVPSSISIDSVKVILSWLANFHAKFLHTPPNGLWKIGTYWHLDTRPEELEKLEDTTLRDLAPLIDKKLSNCPYQTLVHGDAKLANFCFNEEHTQVAAIDFQYVGGGCGMKDVAYFIGSCLDEESCEKYESDILEFYFNELATALKNSNVNIHELIATWKPMYHVAWADFHRFLKGWSPNHWKINTYSEKISRKMCQIILHELSVKAKETAIEAGELIMSFYKKEFKRSEKK